MNISKKTIVIILLIGTLFIVTGVVYYFHRPDWQVNKIIRTGELQDKAVQTVTTDRSFKDFEFSPIMNGLTTYVTDLPANANILSLHVQLSEMFAGADGAAPSMQMLIRNDNGDDCTLDINNLTEDIQLLASTKLCAIGQKSMVLIRDASAMHTFIGGSMRVFLSYITF